MTRFIGNKILIPTYLYPKCFIDNFIKSLCSGTEQIVDVKGQIISYLRVGNGDRKVLCFPGTLGTMWSDFRPQIERLDREKLTVIAWDPPGYGGSFPPMRTFGKKFYNHDADAAYDFMMRLGIKKYSLLGWNDGGISSLILAARHPENVERLIIWGAKSFVLAEDMEHYEKFRDISKWPKKMKASFLERYSEETAARAWGVWCDAVADIFKSGGDICDCCLKNIKCPTLILYGDRDSMVSSKHPHHLYSHIENAKLYRFAKGEHHIHLKYTDEFNKVVTDFILSKYCRRK